MILILSSLNDHTQVSPSKYRCLIVDIGNYIEKILNLNLNSLCAVVPVHVSAGVDLGGTWFHTGFTCFVGKK